MKLPANIDHAETFLLQSKLCAHVASYVKTLTANKWRFYVVNQSCGRCYFRAKIITIPIFAIKRKTIGYLDWYVAHECAHAYAGREAAHGQNFMNWLCMICPEQYQQYELNYKPRNASFAGIQKQAIKEVARACEKFDLNSFEVE